MSVSKNKNKGPVVPNLEQPQQQQAAKLVRDDGKPQFACKMVEATTYPKFCPNCGARRMLQDPITIPATTFISEKGKVETQQYSVVKSVPYCTRCGFLWQSLKDPGHAITVKLTTLNDNDLWSIFQFFYNIQKNFVKNVAEKQEKNMSSVLRVIQGERASSGIKAAVLQELRDRLAANGDGRLI